MQNNKIVENIPNILSVLRLFISLFMLVIADQAELFVLFYIICAITDFLDGFIARKLNCESSFGAKLDSLGDLVFFFVIVVYFLLYHSIIFYNYLMLILLIVMIRLSSVIICYYKNRSIYSIHSIANKITGLVIILGIPFYLMLKSDIVVLTILFISIVSALEEMLIMLFLKKPDTNLKSIFIKS